VISSVSSFLARSSEALSAFFSAAVVLLTGVLRSFLAGASFLAGDLLAFNFSLAAAAAAAFLASALVGFFSLTGTLVAFAAFAAEALVALTALPGASGLAGA